MIPLRESFAGCRLSQQTFAGLQFDSQATFAEVPAPLPILIRSLFLYLTEKCRSLRRLRAGHVDRDEAGEADDEQRRRAKRHGAGLTRRSVAQGSGPWLDTTRP